MRRLLLLAPLLLLGGCLFHNMSPVERLRDATYGLNDEVRWARMDLATERVAPAYQSHFTERHARWGHIIRIADDDVVGFELADDRDAATTVVVYSWYTEQAMLLHQTTVRQHWKRHSGQFYLTSEKVLGGDARLLEVPPQPQHHTTASARATDTAATRIAAAD